MAGLRWVARDFNGHVIGAVSKVVPSYFLPAKAETLSIREALSWIKRHNWSNVCIELNAF